MTALGKRPKIFGTGLIALDLVMGANPETTIQSWAGGTCGSVVAIMAYLGWKAFPIARMNSDPASDRVRADLRRWGVGLELTGCAPTSHTPIIIQQIHRARDGYPTHRFLWSCPHCEERLPGFKAVTQAAVETVMPSLRGRTAFFMDRLSRAALTLAAQASAEGAIVVFEPSGKSDERLFAQAIKLAHVVKYSDQRLGAAGGTMQGDSSTLLEVQTLGAGGLRYQHRFGKGISSWSHLKAVAAPRLVDTCGSGDWCTAGLLAKVGAGGQAGLRRAGVDAIRRALFYGQALAAWNCGFEGARGDMYAIERKAFGPQIEALQNGRPHLAPVESKIVAGQAVACPACPPDKPNRVTLRQDRGRQVKTKVVAA